MGIKYRMGNIRSIKSRVDSLKWSNKIDKSLARLRYEKGNSSNIINEQEYITIDLIGNKEVFESIYEQFYANKLHNIDEMGPFLETQSTKTES